MVRQLGGTSELARIADSLMPEGRIGLVVVAAASALDRLKSL